MASDTFMEKILFALNAIKLTQQTHTQCFSELIKKVDDAPLHSTDIPDLPFSTVEDLLRYDEELGAKSEARVAMKKHMAIQGGESTQQKTSRIFKSMLSWNVAVQFSWFGAKGKKKFSDLNICKLMCSSLTNDTSFRATLKDTEKAGMSWFRHAPERAAGERSTEADSA
ncbi:uncharacterized protein LOC119382809 [Rhipicephalus sanguineus]|uniref:uncharacterized protein LOC119382809 n=1 Tax=Rhipicephalus sanguineus TaxID=34632 RepID=UPI0018936DB2|nr:uncharacterized protein LOC119382809 [Rhipicephalus sanguineus]